MDNNYAVWDNDIAKILITEKSSTRPSPDFRERSRATMRIKTFCFCAFSKAASFSRETL